LFTYYSDGTSAQWVEVLSSAVPNATEIMPAGTVTQTARITAPTGWLLCEGQAVSRTIFARLFDAIGTTYGTGDGSTTFTLPNLRGRVPVGRDTTQTEFDVLGEAGGDKTVSLTEAQLPSHSHTTPNHSHTFSGTTSENGFHAHNASQPYRIYNGVVQINGEGIAGGPAGTNFGNFNAMPTFSTSGSGSHTHTYSGTTSNASPTTNTTGSGQAHQNLQPYIVLNYMIKV
jgi:microcystin-dependent protein